MVLSFMVLLLALRRLPATTGLLAPRLLAPAPASSEASEGDAAGRNRSLGSSPLRPYAPLNAERLKITGLGHWDPVPFLQDDPDLAIACLEPDVLLYGGSPPALEVPSLARESAQEIAALAKKWDSNNLLFLKDSYEDQVSFRDSVRIFNCYKNEACDRQIGDRRARNYRERALRGPSVGLPCGPSLLGLALDPRRSTLRICVTDRKDFYHQLQARPRKAAQNALYRKAFTLLCWKPSLLGLRPSLSCISGGLLLLALRRGRATLASPLSLLTRV